jgi:hypothetical protein
LIAGVAPIGAITWLLLDWMEPTMTTNLSPRVLAVAGMVRQFSREELTQLAALLPALREFQPSDETALLTHFRHLGQAQRAGRTAKLSDPFLGGLTYAESFALSTAQQDALWEQLFTEAAIDLEAMPEIDVAQPMQ